MATRRQLRAEDLRPGGQQPVAQVMWRGARADRVAFLYDIADAAPVRSMTPGRWRAVEAALRARRTCPECGRVRGYTIPTSLGMCNDCVDQHADQRRDQHEGQWAGRTAA